MRGAQLFGCNRDTESRTDEGLKNSSVDELKTPDLHFDAKVGQFD